MSKEWELTDEDIFKLHEDFFGEGSGCQEIDDNDLCVKTAQAAQKKLVEYLIEGDTRIEGLLDGNVLVIKIRPKKWQELCKEMGI